MDFSEVEIEVKVEVDREQYDQLIEQLSGNVQGEMEYHVDVYFSRLSGFLNETFPYEWLSLRFRGNECTLCYKHFYPEGAEKHSHCDELETVVEKPESMHKILLAFGFEEAVTVKKQRLTFVPNDRFVICLDDVEGLGTFVEVEALRDLGGVERTNSLLTDFSVEIGLDLSRTDHRGYPYRLLKKGYDT